MASHGWFIWIYEIVVVVFLDSLLVAVHGYMDL
jgi:hypothetical protein